MAGFFTPDGLFFGGFFAVLMLFAALEIAFKVWMFVDALQRPSERYPDPGHRTPWQVALGVGIFLSGIGLVIAIAYLVMVHLRMRRLNAPWTAPSHAASGTCPSCGATPASDARFCHVCGTILSTQETR